MLILRRKKNESVLIGESIRITVIECAADGVRLAIDAPRQISILREELTEAEQANKNASAPNVDSLLSLQMALKQKKAGIIHVGEMKTDPDKEEAASTDMEESKKS